jgi:RimJ/RimL family protein N-acetyltransferase
MSDYKVFVTDIIRDFKNNYYTDKVKYSIPLMHNDVVVGRMRPVPTEFKEDALNDVHLQTKWRNLHKDTFFVDAFEATEDRTLSWLETTYFYNDDRIIFIIEDTKGKPIGHFGYENFNYELKKAEYGRLMRGDISQEENINRINLIDLAQISILNWGFNVLKLNIINGSLFANNWMVRRFHDKCGFEVTASTKVLKSEQLVDVIEIELVKENFKLLNKN